MEYRQQRHTNQKPIPKPTYSKKQNNTDENGRPIKDEPTNRPTDPRQTNSRSRRPTKQTNTQEYSETDKTIKQYNE